MKPPSPALAERIRAAQEILDARVTAILADKDPEMKRAADFPELRSRVKIMIDGENVTRLCNAFSIPAQQAELFVESANGRKVFEWECGCGRMRGAHADFRRRARGNIKPTYCRICARELEGPWLATDLRRGRLEVEQIRGIGMKLSPADYLAEFADSPLPVRLSRVFFTVRLWGPSLRRRPWQAARDVLPILWRLMLPRSATRVEHGEP